MRLFALAAIACVIGINAAVACDDHTGTCEIEAWRAVGTGGGILFIEGSTTCDAGKVNIRLYDGEKFLGTADGYIEGHALSASALDIAKIGDLSIKYSIEPRN